MVIPILLFCLLHALPLSHATTDKHSGDGGGEEGSSWSNDAKWAMDLLRDMPLTVRTNELRAHTLSVDVEEGGKRSVVNWPRSAPQPSTTAKPQLDGEAGTEFPPVPPVPVPKEASLSPSAPFRLPGIAPSAASLPIGASSDMILPSAGAYAQQPASLQQPAVVSAYTAPMGIPPQSAISDSPCGFVTDHATGRPQCHGGWKCGCFMRGPSDYAAPQVATPPTNYAYQPVPGWGGVSSLAPSSTWFSPAAETHGARCKRQGAGCYPAQPQQQQLYYCFTADTLVKRSDGRRVRMDELQVGEWVLSAAESGSRGRDGEYSRVESWAHRMPKVMADFVQVTLADGKRLKLTEKHLIYKTAVCGEGARREMVYADEVRAGDCLYVVNDEAVVGNETTTLVYQMRVEEVGMVRERGIYSPLTTSGDIVVEGILATTYTLVPHSVLQDLAFKNIKHYDEGINSIREILRSDKNILDGVEEVELPLGLVSLTEMLKGVLFPALELHQK